MKALSVRQPWAWAILCAGKDVENRSQMTKHRGPLLIHASLAFERDALYRIAGIPGVLELAPNPLDPDTAFDPFFQRGAIVGLVDVVGCENHSQSVWAEGGSWHWLLANPRLLHEPVPCKGALGLWTPDRVAIEAVERQLAALPIT